MKKKQTESPLLPEYDFSQAMRGKYAERFAAGSNVVVIASDVAGLFPDSDSVNETLRAVAKIAERTGKKAAA
jgi:hypothetical protein